MQRELRTGHYDVVHIHEPLAPLTGWVAADSTRLPLVGTFHVYSESKMSNGIASLIGARRMLNRLHVRIAVSEAAAWSGRRFFGGHYRVIPNGVTSTPSGPRSPRCGRRATGCGSCSSARPSSARACRCCCARSRRCASTSLPS